MRLILAALTAALLSTSAYAQGDQTCVGLGGCKNDSINNTATGGAGGTGGNGTGGSASATAGGGSATGGNASNTNVNAPVTSNTNTAKIEKGAVDVDTFNLNTSYNKTHVDTDVDVSNEQKQRQKQHQDQSQSAYSESGIDGSANNHVDINYQRNTASAQAAAAIVAGCGDKTAGVAAQGPGFGGSISLPWGTSCKDLATAAFLQQLGFPDAALRYLCREDDSVAEDKICASALAAR